MYYRICWSVLPSPCFDSCLKPSLARQNLFYSLASHILLPQHGWTSLMYAAHYGHLEVALTLLEGGALIEAKDNTVGWSPMNPSLFVSSLLLPQAGWTPLFHAVAKEKLEVAEALLDRGALVDAKDKVRGWSPWCFDSFLLMFLWLFFRIIYFLGIFNLFFSESPSLNHTKILLFLFLLPFSYSLSILIFLSLYICICISLPYHSFSLWYYSTIPYFFLFFFDFVTLLFWYLSLLSSLSLLLSTMFFLFSNIHL